MLKFLPDNPIYKLTRVSEPLGKRDFLKSLFLFCKFLSVFLFFCCFFVNFDTTCNGCICNSVQYHNLKYSYNSWNVSLFIIVGSSANLLLVLTLALYHLLVNKIEICLIIKFKYFNFYYLCFNSHDRFSNNRSRKN